MKLSKINAGEYISFRLSAQDRIRMFYPNVTYTWNMQYIDSVRNLYLDVNISIENPFNAKVSSFYQLQIYLLWVSLFE